MIQIAIDTNAYTALDNGDKHIADIVRSTDIIVIPFIVIGELYYGFINGHKTDINTEKLTKFLSSPRVTVLYPDDQTTYIFGEISTELARAGKPMQQNDIWIAAICKQHGYPLLTLDKGFKNIIGLKLVSLE